MDVIYNVRCMFVSSPLTTFLLVTVPCGQVSEVVEALVLPRADTMTYDTNNCHSRPFRLLILAPYAWAPLFLVQRESCKPHATNKHSPPFLCVVSSVCYACCAGVHFATIRILAKHMRFLKTKNTHRLLCSFLNRFINYIHIRCFTRWHGKWKARAYPT